MLVLVLVLLLDSLTPKLEQEQHLVAAEGRVRNVLRMRRCIALLTFALFAPTSVAASRPVDIAQAQNVDRWIDLSGRTRPVAVLCPKDEAYQKAAAAVCASIQAQGGTRPEVFVAPQAALPDRLNVIALGNVNNSELIARLYWNHYAYEDSLLPGPGAYSLRTIYDPYPWHGHGDVVVLGASDAASAAAAGQALARRLATGATAVGLDYAIEVSSARPTSQQEKRNLAVKKAPSFHVFLESAERYLKTGQAEYAEHAIATLERIGRLYEKKPDHDCDWPEEINSAAILAVWDAFEECPLLTDEARTRHTPSFLRFMRALRKHVSSYSRLGTNDLVVYNHTTYPLLGLYFGARYFRDYYELPEVEEYLRKAHACFRAQAKSYKPSEDSDAYLVLTVGHAIDYCLAEWRTDLLDAGLVRKHADYVIGICDSAGLPAGFGDTGHGGNTRLIRLVLPRAYWWTRDPGYHWVLQHTLGETWVNPFHRDVVPAEPSEHVGVRVFPLDPLVYERTRLRPYYNEPLTPPNVPLEAAFDKIAFREGWRKKAQYLLLDGFSRGNHLHYDGNAIIEFVDRGRRWLWDHDYLTRNTTEHNMLSVVRDGRSRELVPSCAGLICAADVGGSVGLVATELKEYAGIDWRRDIFWRKGEFFVVMDRVTARRSGSYDLDLVWKLKDCGDEKIVGEGIFVAKRYPVQAKTRHVSVVDDPNASGGKAVLFGLSSSILSFVVDVTPGTYRIYVRSRGVNSSSDSLYASTNGSERVVCHVPQRKYGPGNTKYDLTGRTPEVKFVGSGPKVVSLFMRENPPVHVDQIMLALLGSDKRWVVEAELAAAPTNEAIRGLTADRFHIKWPDRLAARTTATTPPGTVIPVRKLFQRVSSKLDVGASVEIANLLYTDDTDAPADLSVRRIGPVALLVRGDECAVLASRGAAVSGLTFDADMVYVSASRIAWANGRSLRLGDLRLEAPSSRHLEMDLGSGEILGDGKGVTVDLTSAAVAAWLEGLGDGKAAEHVDETDSHPLATPLWTYRLPADSKIERLRVSDLDEEGTPEVLVAAGFSVIALNARGTAIWSHQIHSICHDLDAGDLTPNPGLEVIVAGGDTFAHLLSSQGKPISRQQMRGPAWNQHFGDKPWACVVTTVRDLDRDGKNEIIVGAKNFDLRVYDAGWKLLGLARKAVVHGSLDLYTVDIDGDGALEIFVADRYGSVSMYDRTGRRLGQFYTSIGDMQAAIADLDGDGRFEVLGGSSTGDMACYRLTEKGTLPGRPSRWRFDNFGYGVNRLRAADLDGDGRVEVLVASQTGYLYVLDSDGRVKWQDRAGADIVEVIVLERSRFRIAYFDRDGVMTLSTGDGKTRRRYDLGTTVRQAVQVADTLVIGGEDRIVCVDLAAP